MNTAPQSIGVITPLRALWRWFVATPGQPQQANCSVTQPVVANFQRASTTCNHAMRTQPGAAALTVARRPIRMVRVMEAGQTSSQVGRMVISGRMADVCAELDRLVAHEARMH